MNRRRTCKHPNLTLTYEHTLNMLHWFIDGEYQGRGQVGEMTPTGRVRVRCRVCGLDRTFTSIDQAPRWVQDLAGLAEAPA